MDTARRGVPHGTRLAALALGALLLGSPAQADPDNYTQIERGRYLATVGDCIACHNGNQGSPLAGGRGIETPFGTIMSANITPDDETGIGRWTADDFYRAMHEGKRPYGTRLYPAFPYTYYTRVTREDSDAIFAFLRSLEPVRNPVDRSTLPFPLDIRLAMLGWNMLFFTPQTFEPDPGRSAEFNRGAYLVEGLGHCGACHTPMNMLGASRDSVALQGNQIQSWFAPNITGDPRTGIGGWSVEEIVEYLRTGRNARSTASGPMAEVVGYSTSLMTEADLRAIAVYLRERGSAGPAAPAPLAADDSRMRAGEAVYVDNCMACHTRAGVGVDRMFPRLAGSQVVQQEDPTTLLRVVLTGVRGASTAEAPTAPAMPAFGWRLSDEQVAAVVTYIRNTWGNAAPAVAADAAQSLRDTVRDQPAD
ncbi:cytochrome c [Roseomonas sp. NAR14]|uniref:Cytochrome c n=1 Tax=Roseomonas acroporae TaxID=2937791 RepID=A0A9X1YEW5_9PROT|nr:cytochrome c [Roseomonas acroporae]MCK8787850.1 cytochrome c [Roseomonas acroporae]